MNGAWLEFLVVALVSFFGPQLAILLERRSTHFLMSLGLIALTCGIFTLTAPLRTGFRSNVFAQGSVATVF